ncbi:MAG: MoaD/ThiS family protein [Planctomycetaceae bacterium]
MKVTVQLFAAAKAAADCARVEVDIPDSIAVDGCTVGALKKQLLEQVPQLQPLAAGLLFAVNATYAPDSRQLTSGDDVACFPPVSGG